MNPTQTIKLLEQRDEARDWAGRLLRLLILADKAFIQECDNTTGKCGCDEDITNYHRALSSIPEDLYYMITRDDE